MKRELLQTSDGSYTLRINAWDEPYHSRHGAIQEARHVFIAMGFSHMLDTSSISILEIGFGTGLNALITALEARKSKLKVSYTGVEAFPVTPEEIALLDYGKHFQEPGSQVLFTTMHEVTWESPHEILKDFVLLKQQKDFSAIEADEEFNLIYFDAFGPRVQPELWTEEIFQSMYKALKPGGILVTYSAKGSVRRAMQGAGFLVERLPGPPGKREMLRATKPQNF